MGVRILAHEDTTGDREGGAVLFDSVTGWAFGPVFADEDEAESFLDWCREKGLRDVRELGGATLKAQYEQFLKGRGIDVGVD